MFSASIFLFNGFSGISSELPPWARRVLGQFSAWAGIFAPEEQHKETQPY